MLHAENGGQTWAVVLAAGEGTRLHSLTTDAHGMAIPKQYCSLVGGSTLLHDALGRAEAIAGTTRVCAIVAEQHRWWWQADLSGLDRMNVIAQPANRGTGNGILLSLLWILTRDPDARLVFFPADHFFEDEAPLAAAVQIAVREIQSAPSDLVLVGMQPDEPNPELGYVLCGEPIGACRRVRRFVEKPAAGLAAQLVQEGAIWNSFIFAAEGATLLNLFRRRLPIVTDRMAAEVIRAQEMRSDGAALAQFYETLPECDFSRDLLMNCPTPVLAVTAGPCGWSDLGTPERVGRAVGRLSRERTAPAGATTGRLSLATAWMNAAE